MDFAHKSKVDALMARLKDVETRDEAIALALTVSAQKIGAVGSPDAEKIISLARRGYFQHALLTISYPERVGLTDEEFRSLRALIYG
jgi:hypothetical protein